jgi:hypothetical protein
VPTIDARGAATEALLAYLRRLVWRRWGAEAADTEFRLDEVVDEWPEPERRLQYPACSLTEPADGAYEAHALSPTMLEETAGLFGPPNSVLWKLGEAAFEFQADFWATDAPTREAIAAGLPAAFAPGEDGARVILAGSCRYYGRPVRARLAALPRRIDTEGSTYARERRLLARLRCEIEIVELRCGTVLSPTVDLREIGETVEPGEHEAEPRRIDLGSSGGA